MNQMLEQLMKDHLNWDQADVQITHAADGLTNDNYIVTRGTESYVIRISGSHHALLGINRQAELTVMNRVAPTGIGPQVVFFDVKTGTMITRYISGQKWTPEIAAEPANIIKMASTMKVVHHLSPIPFLFQPFEDNRRRIAYAEKEGITIPEGLDKILPCLDAIEKERMASQQQWIGLCHNDPFPNNFIEEHQLRLIDWEYAGMGDLFFDLAGIAMFFSEQQRVQLLEAYFGYCDDALYRNLRQMLYVVSMWNGTWALIQSNSLQNNSDYGQMAKDIFHYLSQNPCI